ncbi:MAG: phosphatidylinositol-specific phospholipase C/glycerophosphodiester phosphodiesterase family protein [Planctomycetaceae bacterium]|nr:phosphatidylinositol-specific phospholipase C/glycerophosphodiester phosphodiesterase family protein [Planctomycetaceae bacterium]
MLQENHSFFDSLSERSAPSPYPSPPKTGARGPNQRALALAALTIVFTMTALVPAAEPIVSTLRQAHAHNDYAHPRPLLDALAQGFGSVEADIFLTADGLLVGHDQKELRPGRTLEKLYLDPLRERIRSHDGWVYTPGFTLWLLIDVKTDAEPAYAALHQVLNKYDDILSVTRDGKFEPKGVTIVLSGNRAQATIAQQTVRYVGIDGRPEDLNSNESAHLRPWISASWSSQFQWKGDGPLPDAERQKLTAFVEQAHARGRLVRFWATPEKEAMWRELAAAKVDLINTDRLADLRKFLLEQ